MERKVKSLEWNKQIQKIGQAKSISVKKPYTMQKSPLAFNIDLSILIIFNAIGLMNSLFVPVFSRYEWNRI